MISKSMITFVTSPSEKPGETHGLRGITPQACARVPAHAFSGEESLEAMPPTLPKELLSARQGWAHGPICSSAANVSEEALRLPTGHSVAPAPQQVKHGNAPCQGSRGHLPRPGQGKDNVLLAEQSSAHQQAQVPRLALYLHTGYKSGS